MPKKLCFLLLCCFPAWLLAQEWELRPQYTDLPRERLQAFYGPERVPAAFAPDSVLYYYQPDDDPSIEEILARDPIFSAGPKPLDLETGDILWMKVKCINVEARAVRYLLEADLHYELWSTVDAFEVDGDTVRQTIHMGNQLPAADKPIRNARNLFWLDFGAGAQKTLLLRLVCDFKRQRSGLVLSILNPEEIRDFEAYTFRGYNNPIPFRFNKIPHAQALHSLEYFFDKSSTKSFAEMRRNWDQYAKFLTRGDFYRVKGAAIWCRLKLINPDTTSQQLLLAAEGDTKIIDVYLPQSDGSYRKVRTGLKAAKGEKVIDHTFNLFDYRIRPLDTAHLFLQYHAIPNDRNFTVTSLVLGIFMFEPFTLMTESRHAAMRKGAILGILLFQLFYFLLRSFLEKNKLGLFYALMVLGFTLLFIFLENRVNTFIALRLWVYQRSLIFSLSLIFFSLGIFHFTDQYLRYRSVSPWIYRVQKLFLWIIIILQSVYLLREMLWSSSLNDGNNLFFEIRLIVIPVSILGGSIVLYILLAIRAYFKKIPYATNFLIAFSPFFLTLILFAGEMVFHRLQDLTINLVYIGFSLTSVLFAIVGARRHNEMKIKEAQAKSLLALDRAKSEFYSNITHEFRTPLTVIMGMTDTINGHDRQKEVIKKNSQEVLALVQQLLDISKAQSGMLQLKMVDDNVVPYLEYLIESFHTLADQKKIDLRFGSELEEIIMSFDREKIRFILNNLVSNAIKFTPERGKVTVNVGREGEELILKVQDTGIGLSKEDQNRIFDRFYRVQKKGLDTQPGDGIGLALIRELVDLLGGKIRVESMLGKGTIFTVTLPLQTGVDIKGVEGTENTAAELGRPEQSRPLLPVGSENDFVVLVIEDNVDVSAYIEHILSPHYKVVLAFDGQAGWETAIELIPDIIVSDVMMPHMDGYQLTEKLKSDARTDHIPIILLTARAAQEDKVRGLAGGADAYLIKPFHEEELQVRINKLIESRRKLQESFAQHQQLKAFAKQKDPFLAEVLEVLNENYEDEDFGIQQLISSMHLSRMQVHRKLKALTGYSTSQFLNNFRLEKGKVLLADERLNISEVAYSCGFGDPGYFRKLFVKKYGLSPQAYRNSLVS